MLLQGEAPPVGSTVVGFTRETIAAGLHEVIYRLGVGSLASGPVVPQIHLPDGSIVIDALKFTAGNVVRDSTDFGVGLGVIRSSIMPSFAEYEIPIPSARPIRGGHTICYGRTPAGYNSAEWRDERHLSLYRYDQRLQSS